MKLFSSRLLRWFDQQGRHDLPWQHNKTAYRVWVSEIMLQQTQVTTVIPYYQKFMARFPDIATLATAAQDEVMAHWAGLGYYSRARNLHRAAQQVVAEHHGIFPTSFDEVIALPGIGRSTAGAILAISQQQRHAILDGNVKRVLTRLFAVEGWPGEKKVESRLWEIAENLTPDERVDDYTQAMMDLGATLCTRTKPQCLLCLVQADCQALQQGQPDRFPHKKPKKAKPTKEGVFVLLEQNGQWLLEKRPDKGIWGGLWSFPFFDTEATLQNWLDAHTLSVTKKHEPRKHVFTHFTLWFTPIMVSSIAAPELSPAHCWHSLDKLSTLALPAPLQRLLPLCHDASTATNSIKKLKA